MSRVVHFKQSGCIIFVQIFELQNGVARQTSTNNPQKVINLKEVRNSEINRMMHGN